MQLNLEREEVEAVKKAKSGGNTILIRPTFLMDESFYPAGHDFSKTKDWLVLVIREQDDKFPDPRTADGKNKQKVDKARSDFKKAAKTHYWFDSYEEAEKKFNELTGVAGDAGGNKVKIKG